jgi:hypothetical protein
MDIDDIRIILKKSNNEFDDQMEFFEKNYNKVFMTMGDKENKMYYDSYQELKTDVEWLFKWVGLQKLITDLDMRNGHKGGVRVGFIYIKDMYNNDVGKGGAYAYEAYEAK